MENKHFSWYKYGWEESASTIQKRVKYRMYRCHDEKTFEILKMVDDLINDTWKKFRNEHNE